eukprot:3657674-Alexandrium_andersonii.AAC.1
MHHLVLGVRQGERNVCVAWLSVARLFLPPLAAVEACQHHALHEGEVLIPRVVDEDAVARGHDQEDLVVADIAHRNAVDQRAGQ